MIRLSAFADEISADPVEQLDCLASNGIRFVEFRSIYGVNVLDLTDSQHQEFRSLLQSRGFGLSAIGSPVGKIAIADPLEPHLVRLERAIDLAEFYGTKNIRVFSYYLPGDHDPGRYRDEVMRRMITKASIAKERGVRLVLENERGIFGDIAARVRDIVETVNSESLGIAFDPANFLEVGQPVEDAWEQLRPWVVHFHVKDFDLKTKKNVPSGEGDGQITRLIADAEANGYEGFCTLEPHLLVAAQSHGFTGPERFRDAATALKMGLEARSVAYA